MILILYYETLERLMSKWLKGRNYHNNNIMRISILKILSLCLLMIAATSTLYSVSSNFTVSYEKNYDELAHATY